MQAIHIRHIVVDGEAALAVLGDSTRRGVASEGDDMSGFREA